MSVAELKIMSQEEYLDGESHQETKHEFYNELVYDVYAMTGARDAHVTVTLNLASLFKSHLRGTPGRTCIADMKFRVDEANAVFYPDVFITCDPRDKNSEYEKAHPTLIVEALSSTAAYDRGSKFAACRLNTTLRKYVDTPARSVDVFRKDASGHGVLYPSAAARGWNSPASAWRCRWMPFSKTWRPSASHGRHRPTDHSQHFDKVDS